MDRLRACLHIAAVEAMIGRNWDRVEVEVWLVRLRGMLMVWRTSRHVERRFAGS